MPQSIPAGITSEHILAALAELDRGVEHGFGRATKFQLVDSGRSYDPKAVIGLAVDEDRGNRQAPCRSAFIWSAAPRTMSEANVKERWAIWVQCGTLLPCMTVTRVHMQCSVRVCLT